MSALDLVEPIAGLASHQTVIRGYGGPVISILPYLNQAIETMRCLLRMLCDLLAMVHIMKIEDKKGWH